MLNAVEDRACERGWLIVSETATPGFVTRMTQQHLPRLLRDFDPKAVQRRMSGVSGPLNLGGLTWSTIEAHVVQAGLRSQLEMLTDLLAELPASATSSTTMFSRSCAVLNGTLWAR